MRLQANDGVLSLLGHAINKEQSSSEYTFYLNGDLCQMSEQKIFLVDRGFDVGQSNVYPILKQEDVPAALKLIYDINIPGWWNYLEEYKKYKICSEKEFNNKLSEAVSDKKKD
jgi:hypothetical protein